jgi:ligand-binding SRPBCC domain-containing protein
LKLFAFNRNLWLPGKPAEVFSFFGDAHNLELITPPWLRFEVLSPRPIVMRPGTLIDYRIRIHGIPLSWQTEITEWQPPFRFVDVQKRGPYRLWEHTHTFEAQNEGTLCRDAVRYAPIGGALMNRLFVQKDVENVFNYRQKKLSELIGADGVFLPGP